MTLVSPTSLIRDALNNRGDLAVSALGARTCHSWKMDLDRSSVLPSAEDFAGNPAFHLYLREGIGARAVDLDGNRFIDLSMGFGAQILGHGVSSIQDAVVAQAARGWHFGLVDEHQLELARLVQSASAANERVVFCESGSDATAFAMRAARAFTGRDMIGVFSGSSHGTHDYGRAGEAFARPLPSPARGGPYARTWSRRARRHPGVPHAVADTSFNLTYGHASAFDQIRRRRHELAAVIVEPVRAIDPSFEHAAWLHELVNVCGEAGVLMIFDERLTGFRLAFGGAQERLGVMADLVTYGEIVGAGLPLGAVAGRADILTVLGGSEDQPRIPTERGSGGNALSIAAGVAALSHLSAQRASLYTALEEKSRLLADQFNAFAAEHELPAEMRRAGSIFRTQFKRLGGAAGSGNPAAETAFYALALSKGVLVHASRLGFLSAAHTLTDVEDAAHVLRAALGDVKNDGLLDPKA